MAGSKSTRAGRTSDGGGADAPRAAARRESTHLYTAQPRCKPCRARPNAAGSVREDRARNRCLGAADQRRRDDTQVQDRKSTRLNSSHLGISYAVFCLKKKN